MATPTATTQQYLNTLAGTTGLSKQLAMNVLAGTTGRTLQDAANIYAGTTGLSVQLAMNAKAGTTRLTTQEAVATIPIFGASTVSGLAFWVKSDAGITKDGSNRVSQWADQSGNSRNLNQSTDGYKPIFTAGAKNGQASLIFDGTDDYLATAAFSAALAQPYHGFYVFRSVTWGGDYMFDDIATGNQNALIQYQNSPEITPVVGAVGPTLTTLAANTFGIVDVVWLTGANNTKIRLNNGSQVLGNAGYTGDLTGVTMGGAFNLSAVFANIEVLEMLIYNTTITGSNLSTILSYLGTKYAITLS